MRTMILSLQAEEELAEILAYFENQNAGSNSYTVYLMDKIEKVSAHYIRSPGLGQKVGEGEDRFFRCDNLMFVYSIVENGIEVSTIWDARRDPETLKLIR